MDHIDVIVNRKDSIENELSYGKYGKVSILGVGYWESMSRLETFMQKDVQRNVLWVRDIVSKELSCNNLWQRTL